MKTSTKYQTRGDKGLNRHLGVFLGVLIALAVCTTARGAEIPKDTLIACVLGEGEGEPMASKMLIAEGVMNRGKTDGIFGCKAIRQDGGKWYRGNRIIPFWAYNQAKAVVQTVTAKGYNNKGVTVFGCKADLPKFYKSQWFKRGNFQLVDHQGGTWFFKQGGNV